MPVAAPSTGSSCEGWLWLSCATTRVQPPPVPAAEVDDPGVLPGTEHHVGGERRQEALQEPPAALVGTVLAVRDVDKRASAHREIAPESPRDRPEFIRFGPDSHAAQVRRRRPPEYFRGAEECRSRPPAPVTAEHARKDGIEIRQIGAAVEESLDPFPPERRQDPGIAQQAIPERCSPFPCRHRVTLHDPVGALPVPPGGGQRQQRLLGEDESAGRVEIAGHRVGADDESADDKAIRSIM